MSLNKYLSVFMVLLSLAATVSCSSNDNTPTVIEEDTAAQPDSVLTRIGIRMEQSGGVYKVPCMVNGVGMKFIFDTGASNICISLTEALFLYKNGYLEEADLGDTSYATIADGSIVENMEINLHSIEIGGIMVTDVKALVSKNIDAPLLLGQSAIKKLGKLEIDGDSLFLVRKHLPSATAAKKSDSPQSVPQVEDPSWWDKVCSWFGNEDKVDEYMEAAHRAYKNDMPELAITYCDKAIEDYSANWKPYALKGLIEYNIESYFSAISCYEKYDSLNTQMQSIHFSDGDSISYNGCMSRLSFSYLFKSKDDKALITAQRIFERELDNINAMGVIYTVYTERGHYDKAEKWARKILDTHQDDSEAYFCLAYLASQQGRNKEAIRYYEKCLEIDPDDSFAIHTLSKHYMDINRSYAIELKKKAARLGNKRSQNLLKEIVTRKASEDSQNWLKENGYDW